MSTHAVPSIMACVVPKDPTLKRGTPLANDAVKQTSLVLKSITCLSDDPKTHHGATPVHVDPSALYRILNDNGKTTWAEAVLQWMTNDDKSVITDTFDASHIGAIVPSVGKDGEVAADFGALYLVLTSSSGECGSCEDGTASTAEKDVVFPTQISQQMRDTDSSVAFLIPPSIYPALRENKEVYAELNAHTGPEKLPRRCLDGRREGSSAHSKPGLGDKMVNGAVLAKDGDGNITVKMTERQLIA